MEKNLSAILNLVSKGLNRINVRANTDIIVPNVHRIFLRALFPLGGAELVNINISGIQLMTIA
jgi:hypothetical protein